MKHSVISDIRRDNRGSAIIMALVGIAFVFTLVTTMYSVTLSNAQMKMNDLRIKNNYYSAEEVTEQIRAGLEKYASDAYSEVYQKSMAYFTVSAGAVDMSADFVAALGDKLRESTDSSDPGYNLWDPEKLKAMIDKRLLPDNDKDTEDESLKVGIDLKKFETPEDYLEGNDNKRSIVSDTQNGRVILKNIYIHYTSPKDRDAQNLVSVIKTDFVVEAPKGDYEYSSKLPYIFDYSIIAGIKTTDGSQDVSKLDPSKKTLMICPGTSVIAEQSIYGGDNGIQISDGSGTASLQMNKGYLVTKGNVSLEGLDKDSLAASLTTKENTRLYANELVLDEARAELGGFSALADDLVYNGEAEVSVTGGFVGFGNSTTQASESSAILVNHTGASLKAGDAKLFYLFGKAFAGRETGSSDFGSPEEKAAVDGSSVSGSQIGNGGNSLSKQVEYSVSSDGTITYLRDIPLGKSIAVKADQTVFLIPAECIGVKKKTNSSEFDGVEDEVVIGQNPVPNVGRQENSAVPSFSNYGDYDSDGNFKVVDFDKQLPALGGKALKDYSKNYRYGIRYVQGQYGQNLAYFYLIVDDDKQEAFLSTEYADQNQQEKYFKFYVSELEIPDDIRTAGTYPHYDDLGSFDLPTASSPSYLVRASDYKSSYLGLYRKLVDSSTSLLDEEKDRNIFDNLMYRDDLAKLISESGTDPVYFYSYRTDEEGNKELLYKGVLTGKDVYTYDPVSNEEQKNVHVIISLGDVVVKKDFSGFIVAAGAITLEGGTITLQKDQTAVSSIMQSKTIFQNGTEKENDKMLIEYFRYGSKYTMEGVFASSEEAKAAINMSMSAFEKYGSLVHYENYSKR